MLAENMMMAFNAIRANKLRSVLTMLGIIIGIGSVIAIVSIGDTMRGMFAELYKDVGITQAYVGIGYWVEDVRDSDYFNLDEILTAMPIRRQMRNISAPPSALIFRGLIPIIKRYSR